MTIANINKMKSILTEKGPTEDGKIQMYALLADTYIKADLTGIDLGTTLLANPPEVMIELATALGCAYFFKFESGDTITAEQAERSWDKYFQAQFRRPRFIATTGTP